MQPVPQDLLKEYVQSQHFTSTTEIMEAMKEMFRDVIQTVMEVEMDEELGRERCERSGAVFKPNRNELSWSICVILVVNPVPVHQLNVTTQ